MPKPKVMVGIDIGTTKVCTLVVEVAEGAPMKVLGVGLSSSQGISKGVITDIDAATEALASSVDKAERLSGYKIGSAIVGISGAHVNCLQSHGELLLPDGGYINSGDVEKVLQSARHIDLPPQKEVLHVIPRHYKVDGNNGIKDPIGLSGFKLEVDAHVIAAHVGAVQNLLKVVHRVGLEVDDLVLQPLASSCCVLTEPERDLGVMLIDIGGGTTDVAIFVEDAIWHTAVIPLGGNNITNDLSIVLGIKTDVAEKIKVESSDVSGEEELDSSSLPGLGSTLRVEGLSDGEYKTISRNLVNEIVDSRISEIFALVLSELRRSGYDDMVPAGAVLTGGTAQLKGIVDKAEKVLDMPVRLGAPEGLSGLAEAVHNPAFSTSVGLPLWRFRSEAAASRLSKLPERRSGAAKLVGWFREFLP